MRHLVEQGQLWRRGKDGGVNLHRPWQRLCVNRCRRQGSIVHLKIRGYHRRLIKSIRRAHNNCTRPLTTLHPATLLTHIHSQPSLSASLRSSRDAALSLLSPCILRPGRSSRRVAALFELLPDLLPLRTKWPLRTTKIMATFHDELRL